MISAKELNKNITDNIKTLPNERYTNLGIQIETAYLSVF